MSEKSNKVARHKTPPEDLQASEIRYRRLFESARDGILILDAASRKITDVNPFMVELLGYSRDEFLGTELWEIGLFKDKDESQAAFRELQEKGYIRYEDMPLQTKAGKQWDVEFVSNVYRENGHHVIQCNIRDITARKRAEEALALANKRVVDILESITDAFFAVDHQFRFTYLNRHAEPLLQRKRDEILGKSIWEEFPEAVDSVFGVGSVFHEQHRKAAAEQVTVNFEEFFPPLDTWFDIHIYPGPDGLSVYFHDIGMRKHAERKLKLSEVRYRRLFEAARDGILLLDEPTGKIFDANPFIEEMLGYSQAELVSKELWQIGMFRDAEENKAAFRELREQGYIRCDHLPLKTKSGQTAEVEFVSNVYQVDDRQIVQCNIRDITERVRLERQTHEQAEALAELHHRKDEFLAMLSHELRNPLSAIFNALHVLGLQGNENPIQQRAMTTMERQVGQLAHLVDDLLEVSRVITGRIQLHLERLDLRDLAEHAIASVRPLIERRRHELSYRYRLNLSG